MLSCCRGRGLGSRSCCGRCWETLAAVLAGRGDASPHRPPPTPIPQGGRRRGLCGRRASLCSPSLLSTGARRPPWKHIRLSPGSQGAASPAPRSDEGLGAPCVAPCRALHGPGSGGSAGGAGRGARPRTAPLRHLGALPRGAPAALAAPALRRPPAPAAEAQHEPSARPRPPLLSSAPTPVLSPRCGTTSG